MEFVKKLIWGVLARFINLLVPIKDNHWIFGADYGHSYKEGAKYLLEYILENHPNITCCFITQEKTVYKDLKSKNIPVYMNRSIQGIYNIAVAECVFTCQYVHDIIFVYKKNKRRFFYLLHGMPYKLAMNSLAENNRSVFKYNKTNIFTKLRGNIANYLVVDYKMDDIEFISVTSDFFVEYAKKDFSQDMDVRILGMPRNDGLFNEKQMSKQKWVDGIDEKFVITYMPTHRAYGCGELSPRLFENNPKAQLWLKDNNIVVLIKQHPNMIPKLKDQKDTEVLIDITKQKLDPQLCIYKSDVLITDYSSVWIDYLLLQRPLIFYYYDNFEENDAGVHYDIKKIQPGLMCKTEDELFLLIKKIFTSYNDYKPALDVVKKFHKHIDANSCERYYKEITKI